MKNKKRQIVIIVSIVLIVLLFVIPFGIAAMIYESNFGERYETYGPMARNMEEFEGLKVKEYTFTSNQGQKLAGYKYYKELEIIKGVVIIAHGLGGGGHNSYMDVADYMTRNGYVVFAYDATGNDKSEGRSVRGIPQGIIDLDYAIRFVKETPDFTDLPIVLFGHSWGGYSVGSALNLHSDVKAVVMLAGFNESMDIIEEEGRRIAGSGINVLLPYISLYERIKLGKYASFSCMEGFEHSAAGVMMIHSEDDEMISRKYAIDIFKELYENNPRFQFIQYKDRGHNYVYYSDAAREYKDSINIEFEEYVKSLDVELSSEIKESYLYNHLNKELLFILDEELMNRIVNFYDNYIK